MTLTPEIKALREAEVLAGAVREALEAAYHAPRGKRWWPELVEDKKAIRRILNSPDLMGAIVAALSDDQSLLKKE